MLIYNEAGLSRRQVSAVGCTQSVLTVCITVQNGKGQLAFSHPPQRAKGLTLKCHISGDPRFCEFLHCTPASWALIIDRRLGGSLCLLAGMLVAQGRLLKDVK